MTWSLPNPRMNLRIASSAPTPRAAGLVEVDDAVDGVARLAGRARTRAAAPPKPRSRWMPARVRAQPAPAGPGLGGRDPPGEARQVLDQGSEVQVAAERHCLILVRPVLPGRETRRHGLGLKLRGVGPTARLGAAGSCNGRMTDRVRITSVVREPAPELLAWLWQAYGASL